MADTTPLFFDGHNDILLRLWRMPASERLRAWAQGDGEGHLDLPRMLAGGFGGGMFAIFVPSPDFGEADALMNAPGYDVPLPPPLTRETALTVAREMAELLIAMAAASEGRMRLCMTAADIRAAMAAGAVAAVMHMEGAEAIGADLDGLEAFHGLGLRSLGPVWSRPTVFGHGVPFRFPSGPDIGPGLTNAGRALVKECNRLRIMVDVSHLNEAGFWDVAKLSDAPLVATHSNVAALCASSRNLTARQLHAIRDSGGMVGVNFATSFLRADGQKNPDTALSVLLDHVEALIAALGEDHVGFGSDFDGATIPQAIGDVAGLGALRAAMRARGYGAPLIDKLAHGNWLGVLARTLG